MKDNKQGQIQVTFNWFYVLIAGGVILLFFVGIVFKQKAASENRLSSDVVEIMGSIFTAAGVSEKTKNFIDTSGLTDFTFYFSCTDGVGEFGLEGKPARADAPIMPVFSADTIRTAQMISWSLPYRMPFKVTDMLFITSINTKYILTGSDNVFKDEFMNATEGFNIEAVDDISQVIAGNNYAVRVVDTSGTVIVEGGVVPAGLQDLPNNQITAVAFTGSQQADFYRKKDDKWVKLNKKNPIQIVSIDIERDAAKYGAIFSTDPDQYECNMKKAYERLQNLIQLYGVNDFGEVDGKLKTMVEYYNQKSPTEYHPDCPGHLHVYEENIRAEILTYYGHAASCEASPSLGGCVNLIGTAQTIRELNDKLSVNCLTLY